MFTPLPCLRFVTTLKVTGAKSFAEWFAALDITARTKVTVAIARIEQGNLSRAKSVGEVFSNTRSTLVRATGFISDAMGTFW